jgi:plastocyanin
LWNLCNSDDQDPGDSLNWQFNFGDSGRPAFNADGTFNPDFDHSCRTEHTYREGSYTATVSVTDKHLEDQSRNVSATARNSQLLRVLAFVTPPPAPSPTTPVTTPVNPPVIIQNFSFAPGVITVRLGQTVIWVNSDAFQHTVTADTGAFGSPALSQGATFAQTFNTVGSHGYHCAFHPGMTGTVIVIP